MKEDSLGTIGNVQVGKGSIKKRRGRKSSDANVYFAIYIYIYIYIYI